LFGAVPTIGTAQTSGVSLRLLRQDAWTPLAGTTTLELGIENPASDLAVRVTAFEALTSRTAFDRSIEGRNLGAAITRVTVPVGAQSVATVTLGLSGATNEGPTLDIRRPGVYPLRLEAVVGGREATSTLTTYVVAVPPADAGPAITEPLSVAIVVPVISAPAFAAQGKPEPEALQERSASGRLGALAAAIAQPRRGVPITLQLGGETVQSWNELGTTTPEYATTLNQLRSGAAGQQLIAQPFVPIDAPSLAANGLRSVVRDEYNAGTEAVRATIEQPIDDTTAIVENADPNTLDVLYTRGVRQLVMPTTALRPLAARFTPARPFVVEHNDQQFAAAVVDSGLSALLTGTATDALRAQQLLAGVSLVALEQPSVKRGVVIAPGRDATITPALFSALTAGLATGPYSRPVRLDQLFRDVPAETTSAGPLVRELATPPQRTPNVTRAELDNSANRASALRSLVGAADPRVTRAEAAVLIAPTSVWTGADGKRRAIDELNGVDSSLANAKKLIRVPTNRTFQLTGQRDRIPLTFVNDGDQNVAIRVALSGSRVGFPDGDQFTVELAPNRSTTITVAVEPRTSGAYPLTLTVTTIEGGIVLANNNVTVRATAVTGVGIVIAIAAGLFLALWWGHFIWRRRQRIREAAHATEPVPTEPAA
jgi:hypothetical protein